MLSRPKKSAEDLCHEPTIPNTEQVCNNLAPQKGWKKSSVVANPMNNFVHSLLESTQPDTIFYLF